MSAISALSASPVFPSPMMAQATIAATPSTNSKLGSIMQRVIDEKQKLTGKSIENRVNLSEATMIGGDLFTMGYLAFEGVQAAMPATSSLAGVVLATTVCGVIGGAINIGVGLISLKESIQAFQNGDKVLGLRLFIDFVTLIGIGIVMILVSLASQIGLAGLAGFFAANPWLLPVLFFVITIPLIIELSYRAKKIWAKEDLGAQMKVSELQKLLQKDQIDWNAVYALYATANDGVSKHFFDMNSLLQMMNEGADERKIVEHLSAKMEELQADIGVKAALEACKLIQNLLQKNKEGSLETSKKLDGHISEWYRAIHVRLVQQVLYAISFLVSMVGLAPGKNTALLNASQNFVMAAANAIPLYMDTFWPFKRNTPIVVPLVDVDNCLAKMPNIPIQTAPPAQALPNVVTPISLNTVELPEPLPPLMQQYTQSAPTQPNPVRWQEKAALVASVAALAYVGYLNADSLWSAATAAGNLAQMGLSYIS